MILKDILICNNRSSNKVATRILKDILLYTMTEGAAKYLRGSFHFAIDSLKWIILKALLNSSMPISATWKFIAAKSLNEKSKNLFSSTVFVVQYQVWTTLNITLLKFKKKNKNCFRNIYAPPPPMVQNSGLSSLKKQNLSEVKNKEWFDLDLLTCDLEINRDHLLIEGNPCTKIGSNQVKGSKDIERTTLGLQTER